MPPHKHPPSAPAPAPPPTTTSSPFAAPGERGWRLWRALAEAFGGGLLLVGMFGLLAELVSTLDAGLVLLIGMCALALLVVRRRFPVLSLLGLAALMGVLQVVGLLTAVVAYTTARQTAEPRRRAVVLLAASVLTMATGAVFAPVLWIGSGPYGVALGAVLAATMVIVPGLVGTAAGQQDRLLRALRERTAAAEEAHRLAESESRMHERSRIAAEMHDLLGHRLSLISLHAGGLEMGLAQRAPELRDEAALVRTATRDAMRELREVLGVLGPLGRDTGTDALTDATGTRADIAALVRESRGGGISVEFTWDGPDLDGRAARVRRAVHRVVRESLTNVHRYASGSHVTVTVTHTDEQVLIRARNGAPHTPPDVATGLGSGRGLTGLRERVALLGGSLAAGPTPGGGFEVTAVIPADPGEGTEGPRGDASADPRERTVPDPSGPDPDATPNPSGVQRLATVATGLLGLAGVGVMMLLGMALVDQARPGPGYTPPEEPRLGMSEPRVREIVWGDSDAVRAAATGREPARPPGTTSCVYPHPGGEYAGGTIAKDQFEIVRYCFDADGLTAIDRFTVPMVPADDTESDTENDAVSDTENDTENDTDTGSVTHD
ncbi:sensor histidine kinase [Streptomyces apocyni]|uniref:sensor histidine kinase n=1 Tax=Streptomyces apocyni TaxID=2654677 RepID=UPI0012EAF51D|nr:histidine kinase [Streptomyces apocyni]